MDNTKTFTEIDRIGFFFGTIITELKLGFKDSNYKMKLNFFQK